MAFPANLAQVGPAQVFNAASGTGLSTTYLDNGFPKQVHTLVAVAGAGVTAGTIQLSGSADGTNWADIGTADIAFTAPGTKAISVQAAFRYISATISVAFTGGTVTAYVASA